MLILRVQRLKHPSCRKADSLGNSDLSIVQDVRMSSRNHPSTFALFSMHGDNCWLLSMMALKLYSMGSGAASSWFSAYMPLVPSSMSTAYMTMPVRRLFQMSLMIPMRRALLGILTRSPTWNLVVQVTWTGSGTCWASGSLVSSEG